MAKNTSFDTTTSSNAMTIRTRNPGASLGHK
jgi:hypothetical protein